MALSSSIKLQLPQMGTTGERKAFEAILKAIQVDLDALHAAHLATNAKLDADAGVTDVDYNANDPQAITLVD